MKQSRGSDAHLLISHRSTKSSLRHSFRVSIVVTTYFFEKDSASSGLSAIRFAASPIGVAGVQLQVRKQTVGCATYCTRVSAPRGQEGICPLYLLIIGRL